MVRIILAAAIAFILGLQGAMAQQAAPGDVVWVQIEAQPSLNQVNEALQRRSATLQDVNGFYLGNGWYGVALGPYAPDDAEQVLRVLRAEGRIPRDSYIAAASDYERQIWPVGEDQLAAAQPAAPETAAPETAAPDTTQPDTATAPDPAPEPEPADETRREALESERGLSRDDRAALQVALKWAGFYQGGIDAAFGAGTRRSMADWQAANGHEATGVLTTRQRAQLLAQYNAVLEGLGIALVSDDRLGIEMKIPTGVVGFTKYDPPFAHFDATGDIPARVLLISQEGDQDTLFGLYEIMQTLEIVPETGPRERRADSFTLIGESATLISHTEASLRDGQIKGFTLIWPAGDEERRTRLLGEMQASFTRIDGVLDAAAGSADEQSIDLISGLEIRRPVMSRSGFYVDDGGTVVTAAEVVAACGRITIDEQYDAQVVLTDEDLGIAVLRPETALAPMGVASFQQDAPRLKSDVAVAGYPYGGVLGAPTLTWGEVADLRGLDGEESLNRLALASLDGDAGGPVLDAGGAVVGMLLPRVKDGRQLPEGVNFAADAQAVQAILTRAGVQSAATSGAAELAPAELADRAAGMTVLVSCWE